MDEVTASEPIQTLPSQNLNRNQVLFLSLSILVLACAGFYYLGTKNSLSSRDSLTSTPAVQVPTAIQLISPTIVINDTNNSGATKIESAKLYGFEFTLPQSWILSEVNRRAEPSESYGATNGHDCAEYVIKSPDDYIKLHISPICGYADGGGQPLPKDAVVIKKIEGSADNGVYARIFEANTYLYVSAGETEIDDSTGKHVEMYYGGMLTLKKNGKDEILGSISAIYSGPDSVKDSYLKEADKVVLEFIQ